MSALAENETLRVHTLDFRLWLWSELMHPKDSHAFITVSIAMFASAFL